MIKRIVATAIVAVAAGTAIVASAGAHPVKWNGITHVDSSGKVTVTRPQPNDVWVGNELAGRDPDANVRLEILRTLGNL
jgi:hypothetical protein